MTSEPCTDTSERIPLSPFDLLHDESVADIVQSAATVFYRNSRPESTDLSKAGE